MCKTALPANQVHILFFLYYIGSTYQQTVFSNYFLVDYSLEIKTSQTEALTLFIPRTIHFIMHVVFSGRTDNRITEHEIMLGRVATSQEPVSLFFFTLDNASMVGELMFAHLYVRAIIFYLNVAILFLFLSLEVGSTAFVFSRVKILVVPECSFYSRSTLTLRFFLESLASS